MVRVATKGLELFDRFSLYNSPYPAHDRGHAIDLYPAENRAPSPVSGTVETIVETAAPVRADAEATDYLIIIDTGSHLARVLHVDPAVREGDHVSIGDDLGRLIDSGYFAPWVGPHLHLGFRDRSANPTRATGSHPVTISTSIQPVPWDGTATVIETQPTYVDLDAPTHPNPGTTYAGLATQSGEAALDGGLPHYEGGGLFPARTGSVSVLGTVIGRSEDGDISWNDITVRVCGSPVLGLSLAFGRDTVPIRLVCPDHTLTNGERVSVSIRPPAPAED